MFPQITSAGIISEERFSRLIMQFRDGFLHAKNYYERIARHRSPMEVRNEVRRESYDYLRTIDYRPEMQDLEVKNGQSILGYVPTRIKQIWESDKAIKTLYKSTAIYCELTGKDFNTIAVHIAERRGIEKAAIKISWDIRRSTQNQGKPARPRQFMGNINVVNGAPLLKSLSDYECGKTHVAQISSQDIEIEQFDTDPFNGFEFPQDFPNCCEKHRSLLKVAEEKFQQFPDCCQWHRNLRKASWFDKDNYSYMPLKVVTTSVYTWDCLAKCIDNPDWYKEITDYINYTIKSFGQFPDGFGAPFGLSLYLDDLKHDIESEKNIPAAKKERLLVFIQDYCNHDRLIEPVDLNLLIGKYKEWLKIFPFDLPFFEKLRPFFEGQMPILSGAGETNMYTGITAFKLKSKEELIGFLAQTTLRITQEINSLNLYKQGQLQNAFEMQRQVIIARRELEIGELDKADWKDRKEYIKLLKKWLAGEKRFLSEIMPIIKKEHSIANFIANMVDGIRELQGSDTDAPCIVNVRNDLPDKEHSFRSWFKTFLAGRYPNAVISAEEKKGGGKIDLKITQKPLGSFIVEFKGWWNYFKTNAPEQLCSYLTDFEKEGYIFMINHLKHTDINDAYKALVTGPAMKYVNDSWQEHQIEQADLVVFESRHKFAVKEKTIYHFIFNVHFSNQVDKTSRKKK